MAGRFEGWYFKQQAGGNMLALIPAVSVEKGGRERASLQIIMKDASFYLDFPASVARIDNYNTAITLADSTFSKKGIELNVQSANVIATGHLRYGKWTMPDSDIMGPYRFVPFMECRHSVYSVTHAVTGRVTINGRLLDFKDGVGYVEGDSGRSFPKRYIWTQYSWFDARPCSLMLSAAVVRPFGRPFVGVIGFVFWRGRELRFATYRGAKLHYTGGKTLRVYQDAYVLTAELISGHTTALRAPSSGKMTRLVREGLCCKARYTLTEKGRVLFDITTDQASFEYEF
ncbi:hypothetical protein IZU99_00260 [Oscillospiraceae bacterium CM]|nr:hypothetical protein IZU99_00260 [Oscillospiraceae bacterium CM]